jgi:hypothetical protein
VVLKTPKIEDIHFQLGANYDASGGESSNQVSTYLGFGFFLIGYLQIVGKSYTGITMFDRILLFTFILQTILTFSRGGFIVSTLLLVFIFYVIGLIKFDIKIYKLNPEP